MFTIYCCLRVITNYAYVDEMEVEEVMLAFIFHVTAVGRQGWMIDD
jgi:hypothetical protein